MKKWLSLLLVLTLVLAIVPSGAFAKNTTFTVMVYLCGTDLESDGGMATRDLKEMIKGGITKNSNVTLYVQTGGTRDWQVSGITNRKVERWLVTENGIKLVDEVGTANMGDESTFYSFLEYGFQHYAADRYAVVLWDHGGGATGGVCYDEMAKDVLSMAEIYSALKKAENLKNYKKLEFVGFDACLMASYEMARHLQPYAHYMIASEELEPGTGWYYAGWLGKLQDNPDIGIPELGKIIVDTFISATVKEYADEYATLSVVDLSKLDGVSDALNGMANSLLAELQAGNLKTISRLRQNMRSFGEMFDSASDMIDLNVFAEAYSAVDAANAKALLKAVSDAVVYSNHTNNLSSICGLSVLVPFSTKSSASSYLKTYDEYGLYDKYTGFVSSFASELTGSSYVFGSTAVEQTSVQDAQVQWFSQFATDEDDYYAGYSDYSSASSSTSGEFGMDDFLNYLFGSGSSVEYSADSADPFADVLSDDASDYFSNPTPSSATGGITGDASSATTYDVQTGAGTVQMTDPFANASGDYAYTVTLTADEMQYLAKAEANLMMDLSDEDGAFYVELGYIGAVQVDWKNGVIYGLFDGTWPCLDGQMVCMYDQISNENYIRSLIPAKVNGVEQYLLVVFDTDRPQGEVVGVTEGYTDAGLPVRGYTELQPGDVVIPMYELIYWDEEDKQQYEPFEGDPITVGSNGKLPFGYEAVESDADYVYGFCLNDIFGGYQFTDFISLSF